MSLAVERALLHASVKLMGIDEGSLTPEQIDDIREAIAGQESGLILDRDILQDQQAEDEYQVAVRLSVDSDRLRSALRGLQMSAPAGNLGTTIVVLIAEPESRLARGVSIVTTELQSGLLASGIRVVDPAQVAAIRQQDQVSLALRGDVEAARAVARRFSANAVLCGTVSCDRLPKNAVGFASRARIDVRLYHADTGELVAAEGLQRSGLDASPDAATRRAYANTARELSSVLALKLKAWQASRERRGQAITVHVANLPYAQYPRLKRALDDGIPGLRAYQLHGYDEVAQWLEFEADFEGRAEALADAIASKAFPQFKLTLLQVSANRIQLRADSR